MDPSIGGRHAERSSTQCLPTKKNECLGHAAILQSREAFPSGSIQVRASVLYFACSSPNLIDSGKVDEKCTANLFSVGKPDKSSYYDIWQGVNAAFSVCIRHGKFGGVKGIGMLCYKNQLKINLDTLTETVIQVKMVISSSP